MRTTTLISVLLAGMLLLSGCDFFRLVAGRPTSGVIDAKRGMMMKKIAQEDSLRQVELKRHADSIAFVHKQTADSVAAMEAIRNTPKPILAGLKISERTRQSLSRRYYVMIGSFGNAENADKLASRAAEAGYEIQCMKTQNGFSAVGVNSTDHIAEAYASLLKVLGESFCPADAWIFDTQL